MIGTAAASAAAVLRVWQVAGEVPYPESHPERRGDDSYPHNDLHPPHNFPLPKFLFSVTIFLKPLHTFEIYLSI